MDTHSLLISPDARYRQVLKIVLDEEEIADLYQVLSQIEETNPPLPKVASDLKLELWYMLLEIRAFNAALKERRKP